MFPFPLSAEFAGRGPRAAPVSFDRWRRRLIRRARRLDTTPNVKRDSHLCLRRQSTTSRPAPGKTPQAELPSFADGDILGNAPPVGWAKIRHSGVGRATSAPNRVQARLFASNRDIRNNMPKLDRLSIYCCVTSRARLTISLEIATEERNHRRKSWEERTMGDRGTDRGEIWTTRRLSARRSRCGAPEGAPASGSDRPRIPALALRGSARRPNSSDCRADTRLLSLRNALSLGRSGVLNVITGASRSPQSTTGRPAHIGAVPA